MIFELTMPLPPSMNEIINQARSGWQASAGLKKYWTNLIGEFVKECGFCLDGAVWIEFHWYLKNFGRDSDNVAAAAKFIMDGLVTGQAIRNDNLTVIQSPVVHYYHRSSGDDGVLLRLSQSPDFLLDNFIVSNQFSRNTLEKHSQKITYLVSI
ncbi:MAG: RusA family crossover junction endodeoxyribonuclease [Nostoc sp.]